MKKIYNNIIPFKNFTALTLWPFVFIRKDRKKYYKQITENHENIHGKQQKEIFIILFLLWYSIEWIIKWCYYKNLLEAYKNISFEREAYSNESNILYIYTRKHYSWIKYIYNKQ